MPRKWMDPRNVWRFTRCCYGCKVNAHYHRFRTLLLMENIYCWLWNQMMKVIILHLLLLKFSDSILAVSQSRSAKSSFENQKIFITKVQGAWQIIIEKFHSLIYHSIHFGCKLLNFWNKILDADKMDGPTWLLTLYALLLRLQSKRILVSVQNVATCRKYLLLALKMRCMMKDNMVKHL